MTETDDNQSPQPLIIVKRRGGHHDDHHGGVWKIAFADFMTAMMAFFLVMWLINAANDETRSQVASYFNPVKLTDAVAGPKGVRSDEQFTETEQDENNRDITKAKKNSSSANSQSIEKVEPEKSAAEVDENTLFKDPYAVLNEIAGEPPQIAMAAESNNRTGQNDGLAGGEAFRDPFDPAFWQDRSETDGTVVQEAHPHSDVAIPKNLSQTEAEMGDAKEKPTLSQGNSKSDATNSAGTINLAAGSPGKSAERSKINKTEAKAVDAEGDLAAANLRAEIVAAAETSGPTQHPKVSVDKTDEGFVVSLTDDVDFGMFASASARPNADMVRFMDQIAAVLLKRSGQLIVRGHTDSRPFRSDSYDNWRLSSARAHMAYHMLVRGGVQPERFVRIEGHADRDPKNPANTEAAENRRIEILVVDKKS